MKKDDYKRGLAVRLAQPLRVRCCDSGDIPSGATIVLFDKKSQNRAMIGLYFDPGAPYSAINHAVWSLERPLRKVEMKPLSSPPKAGDVFPNGGFCLHKVKISGIQGEVVGAVDDKIFLRESA